MNIPQSPNNTAAPSESSGSKSPDRWLKAREIHGPVTVMAVEVSNYYRRGGHWRVVIEVTDAPRRLANRLLNRPPWIFYSTPQNEDRIKVNMELHLTDKQKLVVELQPTSRKAEVLILWREAE